MTNKPFYELPLLSLDTETTGTDPWTCSIVTCNMTYDIPNEEPKIYDWLLNPGVGIPEGASEVHGITDEIAQAYGMDPEVALQNIAEHLTVWASYDLPVVVYNASYDLTLLLVEFARYGIDYSAGFNNVIDPYVLDKALDKYRKGKRQLTFVSEHYGVSLDNAHTASADSLASAKIARIIGKKYKINAPMSEVHAKQIEFKKEQQDSLEKYLRKTEPDIVLSREWPYQTQRVEK